MKPFQWTRMVYSHAWPSNLLSEKYLFIIFWRCIGHWSCHGQRTQSTIYSLRCSNSRLDAILVIWFDHSNTADSSRNRKYILIRTARALYNRTLVAIFWDQCLVPDPQRWQDLKYRVPDVRETMRDIGVEVKNYPDMRTRSVNKLHPSAWWFGDNNDSTLIGVGRIPWSTDNTGWWPCRRGLYDDLRALQLTQVHWLNLPKEIIYTEPPIDSITTSAAARNRTGLQNSQNPRSDRQLLPAVEGCNTGPRRGFFTPHGFHWPHDRFSQKYSWRMQHAMISSANSAPARASGICEEAIDGQGMQERGISVRRTGWGMHGPWAAKAISNTTNMFMWPIPAWCTWRRYYHRTLQSKPGPD